MNKVKSINKNKLQIKYIVKSYAMLEDYPTTIDILFEIASDDAIIEGLEFDYNYAKYILTNKITKQKYYEVLKELNTKGFVQEIYCNKKLFHKLLKHPWE